MKMITTFPDMTEFEKAKNLINENNIIHEFIDPPRAYSVVGIPALALDEDIYRDFSYKYGSSFLCCGWVEYRQTDKKIPDEEPQKFDEDLFGSFSFTLLAPCVADFSKLRIICKFSGDISKVLPYVNTEKTNGMFIKNGPIFTYKDAYHMISLYPQKISIAKTDDIKDSWHMVEKIRCMLNDIWARRASIEPTYETREKPPALEIYRRLPGTNCGECNEKTCMAFAIRLWSGELRPEMCKPVFNGKYNNLKPAFLEICHGLGIKEET